MRVFIYGAPGAGKTTLALLLADEFGWPVYHLDQILFRDEATSLDRREIALTCDALAQEETWVIEGNHGAALDPVAGRADCVICLQVGRLRGLLRLVRRWLWTPKALLKTGPGFRRQRLPLHLLRYALLVHPRLEPQHIVKIKHATSGDLRVFKSATAALTWFRKNVFF